MFLGLLAVLALAGGPALAASPAPVAIDLPAIKVRGDLRIGADPSAGEPYFWFAAAKASGFEAELGEAIATKLGVKATFVQTPWRDLMAAVKAGRVDVAINALELRQDNDILFSVPYYMASQAILVRTSEQRVYGLTDLAGRRVATTDGSVASAILGKLRPAAVTRMFADTEAPFHDLALGRSDAVLLESAMVRRHAMADPKKFRLAGLPLLPRPYGVAMRKSAPLLVAGINSAIKELQNNREIARILKGYNLWDSLQAGAPAVANVTSGPAGVVNPVPVAVTKPFPAVLAKPPLVLVIKPTPETVIQPMVTSVVKPMTAPLVKPVPAGVANSISATVPKPTAKVVVNPVTLGPYQPHLKAMVAPAKHTRGRRRTRARHHRKRRQAPVPTPMPF
jgi:ABC-type amino acid transport substrate-binding protein